MTEPSNRNAAATLAKPSMIALCSGVFILAILCASGSVKIKKGYRYSAE
jgi:hypothetical protein